MTEITEIFGDCIKSANVESLRLKCLSGICPFTFCKCSKKRKGSDEKIGICSVSFLNRSIIICPNRFLDNQIVFEDAKLLLKSSKTSPCFQIVPEVRIPGGNVDFFLISKDKEKIIDFCGIEIQATDTIGTLWPIRERTLRKIGALSKSDCEIDSKPFAINWKMTSKTILMEMLHKASTFESMGKKLILVLQDYLFEYMRKEFAFEKIEKGSAGKTVVFFVYSIDFETKSELKLKETYSIDSKGLKKCLGLKGDSEITEEMVLDIIKSKVRKNRYDYLPFDLE